MLFCCDKMKKIRFCIAKKCFNRACHSSICVFVMLQVTKIIIALPLDTFLLLFKYINKLLKYDHMIYIILNQKCKTNSCNIKILLLIQ